ncbi:MAG: COP23 domain-containing protein [Hormoscilla sp.]
MKMKLWSPVLAGAVIIMSAASAIGQSQSPGIKFTCEMRNGIPTTMATDSQAKSQAVFHWQADPWFHNQSPEQLCQEVSKKLQSYYDGGGQGSSFNVHKMPGINRPAICVEVEVESNSEETSCSRRLFTLASNYSQEESEKVLDSILDSKLKTAFSQERGDHRRIGRVPFWTMLFR